MTSPDDQNEARCTVHFTNSESRLLFAMTQDMPRVDWTKVSTVLDKPVKICRNHFYNNKPTFDTADYSLAELERLACLVFTHHICSWSHISRHLMPNRSPQSIKNKFRCIERMLKRSSIDGVYDAVHFVFGLDMSALDHFLKVPVTNRALNDRPDPITTKVDKRKCCKRLFRSTAPIIRFHTLLKNTPYLKRSRRCTQINLPSRVVSGARLTFSFL